MHKTSIETRMRIYLAVLSGSLAAWGGAVANAQESTIVRVEEDWELVVGSPDPNSTAPQVSCSISPTRDIDSVYVTFELNHQSQPEFVAGGLQLQLWHNATPLTSRKFPTNATISESGETVTWTQTMSLEGNHLTFEIVDGTSATWGTFGGQGNLKVSTETNLSNLNAYSPETSVTNSGIGYAANRVQSLVLKRIRFVTSTGDVSEDNTPRNVHTQE